MTFDQLLIQIKSVPYYSNLAAFSSSTAELYVSKHAKIAG